MANDQCGNPLLRDWMKEWMDEASGKQSKMYFTLKKAYDSLCKCPVPFSHPSQAIQLNGIGEGLVKRMEERMRKYCKDNNLPMPQRPINPAGTGNKRKRQDDTGTSDSTSSSTSGRAKSTKPYIPKYRTGAYAILLALKAFHDIGRDEATREQICHLAQQHCDASLTLAEPGKSYTAWNGIKSLLEKGYVYKNGKPAKFRLTETGISLADTIKEINAKNGNIRGTTSAAAASKRSTSTMSTADKLANLPTSSGAAFAAAISSDDEDYNESNVDMSIYVLNPPSNSASTSKNPSTARSRAARINTSIFDFDTLPNQEQSASIASQSKRTTTSYTADIMEASAVTSKGPNRGVSSIGSRSTKRQKTSATSAALDKILAEMEDEGPDKVDMSLYVLNPSQHQSASLENKTTASSTSSKSTTPAKPKPPSTLKEPSASRGPTKFSNTDGDSTTSSITRSSRSSFAQLVQATAEDNSFENLYIPRPASLSSSNKNERYSTPPSSSILRADEQRRSKSASATKNAYSKSDSGSSSSKFPNSSKNTGEVVDLLSSPEPSPSFDPFPADERLPEPSFNLDSQEDYFPLTLSRKERIASETFHYTYLDTQGKPVRHVTQAAVEIDMNTGGLAYLIQYFARQANHPKAKQAIKETAKGDFVTAYLPEEYKDNICPGLPAAPVLPLHREDEEEGAWPASTASQQRQPEGNEASSQTDSQMDSQASHQTRISSQQIERTLSSQAFFPSQPQEEQSKRSRLQELVRDKGKPTFCLKPGEYEIVLVVDTREIQMKGNREYFQENLTKKGILCTTRAMDLGDVVWIARKKQNYSSNDISSSQNQRLQAEELVLDYIVERKRLDDLVSSIKDGRFTEQKTRLKRSGAEKVIYVVEEYNVQEAERFGMQAVQTAMSSTQVIDGFYVKRTSSIDDTIEFLVSVTRLIQQLYDQVTLYCIPEHIITRQNYLELKETYRSTSLDRMAVYVVNYPTFAQLNSKNGSISLHEIFLRMLMTIRGVNAEKALSLMKVYPTPNALLTAFRNKTPEEGKVLAKDATRDNISRRRWGPQISEKLYQVWGSMTYPLLKTDSISDEE